MRFYQGQHRHTCGIDLHAKTMYLCVLDERGTICMQQNIPTSAAAFLAAIHPYRDDLIVGVECMFTWYWLADLCEDEGIPFLLGHAPYMKAIHGAKAKNDKLHALAGKTQRLDLEDPGLYLFDDPMTRETIQLDLHVIQSLTTQINHVGKTLRKQVAWHKPREFDLLKTIHGIGPTFVLLTMGAS